MQAFDLQFKFGQNHCKMKQRSQICHRQEWDRLLEDPLPDLKIVVVIYLWVLLNRWVLCSWDKFLSVAFEQYCSSGVLSMGKIRSCTLFMSKPIFSLPISSGTFLVSLLSNSPIRMSFWLDAVRASGVAVNVLPSPRVMMKGLAALEVVWESQLFKHMKGIWKFLLSSSLSLIVPMMALEKVQKKDAALF